MDIQKVHHRLAGFAYRAARLPDLYQRHGPARIVAEARSLAVRLAQRHGPSGGGAVAEQVLAYDELERIMRVLQIHGETGAVVSAIDEYFGGGTRARMLGDLQALAEGYTAGSHRPEHPVVQASALPASAGRGRRILFVSAHFPSERHGGGNRILNFLKTLAKENEIYFASSFLPEEDDHALRAMQPFCRSILTIPFWKFGDNRLEIKSWLEGKQVDIAHYEWPRALKNYDPSFAAHSIFTYMEAVALRLRMDLDRLRPFSPAWLDTFVAMISALRVELVDAAVMDARIAVTTKDAEFFRSLDPHQEYTILNHGLTFDSFTLPEKEPEPFTLVFSGNFAHYPNVDAVQWFFAEVWEKIRQNMPHARILLVGNRPPRAIQDLADGRHVIVTGSVPDVRPYIQKASVCIAPLISGAGLRGKVIEYAALRRPFVATSIAVEDLAFRDGCDFVLADSAETFASQTVALLTDIQRAREMGAAAYQTAQSNYDTPRLVAYLDRIYDRMETRSTG